MKFGIAGFGVVGKSVLKFIQTELGKKTLAEINATAPIERYAEISILDERTPSTEELAQIQNSHAQFFSGTQTPLHEFIKQNDLVLVSPGVNIKNCLNQSQKLLCELDLFQAAFKKKTIAITGTLGKTTTTKLLGQLISLQFKTAVGGNIGIGMLDLAQTQDQTDFAVLELSSFQLRLNKSFAPDIAIWTNFYPNHLDLHENEMDYFESKLKLLKFQTKSQMAVLSASLFEGEFGLELKRNLPKLQSQIYLVSETLPTQEFLAQVSIPNFKLLFAHENKIYICNVEEGHIKNKRELLDSSDLPSITFLQNWLQVIATLHICNVDMNIIKKYLSTTASNEIVNDNHHRLEHFATLNGIDFYNDSKSTVIQATLAAAELLAKQNKHIILILGGLNKGVDRSSLMPALSKITQIKKIYSFGKNASDFSTACVMSTLEEVLQHIAQHAKSGDIVLFSPAGTSFDFFKNYEHRGQVFKELVLKLFK